jgi:hypothetical protein
VLKPQLRIVLVVVLAANSMRYPSFSAEPKDSEYLLHAKSLRVIVTRLE